jgi:hypothetical protein
MFGGEELCIHNLHLKGAEVFGSQKHKLDIPIDTDEEIHRLDTILCFTFAYHHQGVLSVSGRGSTIPPTDLDFSHVTVV